MHRNIYSLSSSNSKTNKFKLLIYILPLALLIGLIIYLFISYNMLFNSFKTNFSKSNFSEANSILLTKGNLNPVKSLNLNGDLKDYFNKIIKDVPVSLDNNTITKTQAINILTEINRYNFISVDTTSIEKLLKYEDPYEYGLSLYSSEKYLEAYNVFLTVPSSSPNYDNSLNYINNCKDNIKSNLINQVNDLSINNYYTKALNLISDLDYILGNDKDILSKKEEIQNSKNEFIAKQDGDTLATSSSQIYSITNSNINTLSIDSLTNYLVHVDLNNQKTYIYSGSKNNWTLAKTFECSTGIKGSETPEGIFTIKEKGDWFFSETYDQGGKYWVQFSGNYLFHSLPYNKDQSQIVDYTLGKPSSHGCIRLSVSDSKWIYDNIPSKSKVIIN